MYQTSKAARQDLYSVDSVVAAIKTIEDRASARRSTNTPGRRHFLMYKNNLSQ